ncbi:MAG: hypothetical protein ACD_4C00101G0007 [uncultured bacterium (gcode 4)]|uniref:Uncharacterized protein n=1 Tax=uncultured bacterium (gcode 4) TaxID=1234023 RepID=K2GUF5_9BACT|nr:MAG: hypothetical protein ACD_4C00101G0007 [uncultured bacterium (gcode 4)]
MSNVNITGLVKNIKSKTNVYTPIIEAIVNSLQSIEDSWRTDWEVIITAKREAQQELWFDKDSIPEISSFEISDNWVWFNEKNLKSFDTLYSDMKVEKWCKGFWRFMFHKYFDTVDVVSVYKDGHKYKKITFDFWKEENFVENPNIIDTSESDTKTIIKLNRIKDWAIEKKLETIARKLVEKLLIYFINDKYNCPKITLKEEDWGNSIVLNEYIWTHAEIKEEHSCELELEDRAWNEKFNVKIFKIYYPDNKKNKISLTAHNREVKDPLLHEFIPEFDDNFYDEVETEDWKIVKKDYFIKAYVMGWYLDSHVSLERDNFLFSEKTESFYPFSEEDILIKVAGIVKDVFWTDVKLRSEKKAEKIRNYINTEEPYYKSYLEDIDLSSVPYNLTNDKIASEIHRVVYEQERDAKIGAKTILDNPSSDLNEASAEIVNKLTKVQIAELAHYVALRKTILSLFKKSLEIKEDWKYFSENTVHNIIFPTRSNSDTTPYDNHNLWILDEKLNFTTHISSDEPINWWTTERTDLLIFNNKMAFRWENEASNPITIFEFKKPQRDNFVNPSSDEDPIEQIIRYVNSIKEWKVKTPAWRDIQIWPTTPFYWYVVIDLTQKVKDWLFSTKNFKPMPDWQGWYNWFDNINLYIEIISWDKVLKDAEMRNKIFFKKLWID